MREFTIKRRNTQGGEYALEWQGHGGYRGSIPEVTGLELVDEARLDQRYADAWEGESDGPDAIADFAQLPRLGKAIVCADMGGLEYLPEVREKAGR